MTKAIGRQVLAALLVPLLSLAAPHLVQASLLNAPAPHPNAATPGTNVRVDGFPELNPSCLSVAMWLARDPGISAKNDPRLMSLSGTVTIEKGLGQASAGPLVDVPVFTFTVPSVAAGAYLLYYSCPGSPNGWDSLFEGAAFTVTPGVPGTGLPRPNRGPLPAAAWLGAFAVLLLTAGAVFIRRRPGA
jgi:hypothetical protein